MHLWWFVTAAAEIEVLLQTAVMAGIGGAFGLSKLQSVRAGLLLAAGGEFAFVTFQGRSQYLRAHFSAEFAIWNIFYVLTVRSC